MKYPRLFQWLVLAAIVILAGPGTKPGLAAEVKSAAPADWEKTVKAAGEEGALTIYMTQASSRSSAKRSRKNFPRSKSTRLSGATFSSGSKSWPNGERRSTWSIFVSPETSRR